MTTTKTNRVQDWMSPIVCTIKREQPIRDALDLMGQHRISSLPVVDDGRPEGIITIGDFMRAVDETDRVLQSTYPHFDDCLWAVELIQRRLGSDKVYTLMSELLTTSLPTQSMKDAAKIMCESDLHHLLVCCDAGTLVGILSASDFVRYVNGLNGS